MPYDLPAPANVRLLALALLKTTVAVLKLIGFTFIDHTEPLVPVILKVLVPMMPLVEPLKESDAAVTVLLLVVKVVLVIAVSCPEVIVSGL